MDAQLHSSCTVFSVSRWEKGAPRTGARSAKVLARGLRVVCFRRPPPDPHPARLRSGLLTHPAARSPLPAGEGKLHSDCTVFGFQSPTSRTRPMRRLVIPEESQTLSGTDRKPTSRPGRRVATIRAKGSVAPSPRSASRLSGRCRRGSPVPALRFASAGMTRRAPGGELHSNCTVFHARSLTHPPKPPSSRKACSSGVVTRPSSGFL